MWALEVFTASTLALMVLTSAFILEICEARFSVAFFSSPVDASPVRAVLTLVFLLDAGLVVFTSLDMARTVLASLTSSSLMAEADFTSSESRYERYRPSWLA